MTYTHTEKAEVRSVSVDVDNAEERYARCCQTSFPFSHTVRTYRSRPAGSVPGFRPTRKVREGERKASTSPRWVTETNACAYSAWWQVGDGEPVVRRIRGQLGAREGVEHSGIQAPAWCRCANMTKYSTEDWGMRPSLFINICSFMLSRAPRRPERRSSSRPLITTPPVLHLISSAQTDPPSLIAHVPAPANQYHPPLRASSSPRSPCGSTRAPPSPPRYSAPGSTGAAGLSPGFRSAMWKARGEGDSPSSASSSLPMPLRATARR